MKNLEIQCICSFSGLPRAGWFFWFLAVSGALGRNFQANFRAAAQSKYILSGAKHSLSSRRWQQGDENNKIGLKLNTIYTKRSKQKQNAKRLNICFAQLRGNLLENCAPGLRRRLEILEIARTLGPQKMKKYTCELRLSIIIFKSNPIF